MEVELQTAAGGFMTTAWTHPFELPPAVLTWGPLVFQYQPDLPCRFGPPRPVYRQVSAAECWSRTGDPFRSER